MLIIKHKHQTLIIIKKCDSKWRRKSAWLRNVHYFFFLINFYFLFKKEEVRKRLEKEEKKNKR